MFSSAHSEGDMPKPTGAPAAALFAAGTGDSLHNLRGGLPRGGRGERRRVGRNACNLQTACVVISLVEPVLMTVRVRDISSKGFGLLLPNRVSPGTFLAVKLVSGRQKVPRIVRAQVIHATIITDPKSWLMGCVFVTELRKDEVAGLQI